MRRRRRLAAAGWADEGDKLALRDVERQIIDRQKLAVSLGDVAQRDIGHCAFPLRLP